MEHTSNVFDVLCYVMCPIHEYDYDDVTSALANSLMCAAAGAA